MSSRKDMWRLLHDLVSRNDSDFSQILVFVEDILCKESSLIRPYSSNLAKNDLEDIFLIWLINKFIWQLNQSNNSESVHLANVSLQKRILYSCLLRRSILFKKLVTCYVAAIQELSVELPLESNFEIKLQSFCIEEQRISNVDFSISFQQVSVSCENVDDLIMHMLDILNYALKIGFHMYPQVFKHSFMPIMQAFKECLSDVKLQCLRYFHSLFNITRELYEDIQWQYETMLQALALLWLQVPSWLFAECLSVGMLQQYAEVSCNLLNDHEHFVRRLSKKDETIVVVVKMLRNILGLAEAQIELRMEHLMHSVSRYILQVDSGAAAGSYSIDNDTFMSFFQMRRRYPCLLRVFAVALLRQQEQLVATRIMEGLINDIFHSIQLLKTAETNKEDEQYFSQLLRMLDYVEKEDLRREQLRSAHKGVMPSNHLNQSIITMPEHKKVELNLAIEQMCEQPVISNKSEEHERYIAKMGFILQIKCLRSLLSTDNFHKILAYFTKPIEICSKSSRIIAFQYNLALLALQQLCCIPWCENEEQNSALRNAVNSILLQLFSQQKHASQTKKVDILKAFMQNAHHFIAHGSLQPADFVNICLKHFITNNIPLPADQLKIICCTNDNSRFYAFRSCSYGSVEDAFKELHQNSITIVCTKCISNFNIELVQKLLSRCGTVLIPPAELPLKTSDELLSCLKDCLPNNLLANTNYDFTINHFKCTQFSNPSVELVLAEELSSFNMSMLCKYLKQMSTSENNNLLSLIMRYLLKQAQRSLNNRSVQQQRLVLNILTVCATFECINEQWLYYLFKITVLLTVHPHSLQMAEAATSAAEICASHQLQPIQLWHWYKYDTLQLVVRLALHVYLRRGVRLVHSLKSFSRMLGFSCVQEFICKYYRLLTSMILPYCAKELRCKGVLVGISKITRKPIAQILAASFLRMYSIAYLSENREVGSKCVELTMCCTNLSQKKLMNMDIKQTVAEIVIYFNQDKQFVLQALQGLVHDAVPAANIDNSGRLDASLAKFVSDRFLGIITYFELCLAEINFERSFKEDALHSLGQIMQFIGKKDVTHFRFKIIAMLSFVLTLRDQRLQKICLKIWKVFLEIVDMKEVGPLLSRIVASLQPMITDNGTDVNAIYTLLLLKNGSSLSAYVPELYFIEQCAAVAPEIRNCISRKTNALKDKESSGLELLKFYCTQIGHENAQVRVHGLDYLTKFIGQNRDIVNSLILDEIRVNPIMLKIVEHLVEGAVHEDSKLCLASAVCMGELGAIDPSYLVETNSVAPSYEIPLNVHTDEFAIMILTELCRAYQFQKDSKFVDNFSLAIQETLSLWGVSPKEKKKMNVWEAIPERMRQIMEPLLSSCYTASYQDSKCKDHPIFNSSYCRTCEDWAFYWATRLIDYVQPEDTRHLMNSYKPSMKRDSNTLALMLPYIIIHSLQFCTEEQMQQMTEELNVVFNIGSNGTAVETDSKILAMKQFRSTKYAADTRVDKRKQQDDSLNYDAMRERRIQGCVKICSEQMDFLQRWIYESQSSNVVNGSLGEPSEHCKRVQTFMQQFDKLQIAKANFNATEHARSLMYLESYIEEDIKHRLQNQLSFLIEIHGKLLDADSVEGAVFLKKYNLSLAEEILVNKIVERPEETVTCYEQLISQEQRLQQEHIKGMIDCYMEMDVPETALLIADGLWQKLTQQYTDDYFKECKAELLWRLCRYDDLQDTLDDAVVRKKTTNLNIQCAKAFLLFRPSQPLLQEQNDIAKNFSERMDDLRINILSSMHSFSLRDTYANSYGEVTKLHQLCEIEQCKTLLNFLDCKLFSADAEVDERDCLSKLTDFFINWDARICILQPTSRTVEPILCLRKNLLIETKRYIKYREGIQPRQKLLNEVCETFDNEIGKLWIQSVQINREAGNLQQAHLSVMKAEEYKPRTLFLEKSQLLWSKGDQTNAFKLLEENLERLESKCQKDINSLDGADKLLYAEAKFLQAAFNAESMNICAELNVQYFREAILANRQSEKCYIRYAQYLEKFYESLPKEQKDAETGQKRLIDIMLNYAKSLKYGFENVYQSMPRLLSFWLDFTSRTAMSNENSINSSATTQKFPETAKKMNDLMNNCISALPTSLFYVAFSQLLSRICHPSNDVFLVLRNIIVKLIQSYPQQSLWMLLPIFKSAHTNRVKRCRLILTDSRFAGTQFQKLLTDFNMLTERLIELTNKELPLDNNAGLSALVKQLPMLLKDPNFSNILLPFEKYMQLSLPMNANSISQKFNLSSGSEKTNNTAEPKNPFPYTPVYITSFKEEVSVLRSAARPKKITILCSDGVNYDVMLKPKDDLRKDFRLMEFNGLVKRYLRQDPQSRHRNLRIRTYAAIPFNEECGLVQWLPKLNSFRNICVSLYRLRGLGIEDRLLRKFALPKTDPIEKKRNVFLNSLLTRHPPIFQEWFRKRFPTPQSWYEARNAYVKTIAVMSMVGFILGLGDRHGENVLFDETNGDAVHVDFNCLFNQGETFAYPELVPFRLTHNMTFAMGPLGVQGVFRKCCEITLRLLQKEANTLMSVLRPFVYDLVALNRLINSKKPSGMEVTDPKATQDVQRIKERLLGYVNRTHTNSMPLSVEGQVNFLISEATSIDNLAAMYIGWGSYI